jgi:hypothetical protein
MVPLLVYHGCWSSRLPIVEAWKVVGGELLWWLDGSLLRSWGRGMVELLRLLMLEFVRNGICSRVEHQKLGQLYHLSNHYSYDSVRYVVYKIRNFNDRRRC